MIGDWFEIDGMSFNVSVIGIKETANILYSENTGRTIAMGARMVLDPVGTFIGHRVTVKRTQLNLEEYDRLFNYIIRPRYDGVKIKIVHDQTTINYDAYVSSSEREVERIDDNKGAVYWKELDINFVPMEAQILP